MDLNLNAEITQEQSDRWDLSYKFAKEIVEEFNFEDSGRQNQKEYDGKQSYYFKIVTDYDVDIYAQLATEYHYVNIRFSLARIAYDIVWLIELMLSDDDAKSAYHPSVIYEIEKRNIDILTLFNIKKSEINNVIEEYTKQTLRIFVKNIHSFTRAAIVDALGHSKLGVIQHSVKPQMKEHWEKLGLPKDFDLVTQDQLDSIRQYDVNYKKWFVGDKKQLLNIETLADEANELRKQYIVAKKFYEKKKIAFDEINPGANLDEWEKKWIELRENEFPKLYFKALDEIKSLRPFELAALHLAEIYDYNEESMRKKITKSRKLQKNNK